MRKKHAMSFGKTLLARQVLIILHLFVTKLRCILFPIPYQIATLYLGRRGGGVDVRRVVAIAIPFAFYATFVKIPIYL